MDEQLSRAMGLQRAGRVEEAEGIYREILARLPGCAEAMALLGVAAAQRGRLGEGIAWIQKAIGTRQAEGARAEAEWWSNLGEMQRRAGRGGDAVESLRRAVEVEPGNAWGHYNLGVALRGVGKGEEAIGCFRRAVELSPGIVEGWNNLGAVLMEVARRGDPAAAEEAERALRRGLALKPSAPAWWNLGSLLRRMGRSAEAVAALEEAVRTGGERGDLLRELAMALLESKRIGEAEAMGRRAVESLATMGFSGTRLPEAWRSLGVIRTAGGDRAGALAAYEEAFAAMERLRESVPEDWQFEREVLRAGGGGGGGEGFEMPREFVKRLFDGYALRFEKHLVGELGYRMPAMLAEAVREVKGSGGGWDILDLGCGTGLCGEALRPLARSGGLIGVDLAPAMVEIARRRGVFDEVLEGDLVDFLRRRADRSVDILLAGDVFIYVGEVGDVFREAARVLRDGGVMAFSIEKDEGGAVRITAGGRYAHGEAYIRTRAAAAGLGVLRFSAAFLRADVGEGRLVVLQKAGR